MSRRHPSTTPTAPAFPTRRSSDLIGTAGQTAVGHYVANTYNLETDKSSFPEDFKKRFGHYPAFSEPLTVYALRTFHEALKPLSKKGAAVDVTAIARRSEEHTSELQSLMRSSYAVFCLKQKK